MMTRLAALVFAVLLSASSAFAGVLDEIASRQQGVTSITASFNQEKKTQLLDRPVRSRGTIAVRPPWGVRWDYTDSMKIVYDGKDLYIHYLDMDEAEKIAGAQGFVGPLVFDIKTISKEYVIETETSADGAARLALKPKKPKPFSSMGMVFSPGSVFPSEVTILEESGDVTVIRFKDIKTNVDIPKDTFVFTLPPGVKMRVRQAE